MGSRQQVLPDAHACDAENAAGGMSFTVALVDADGNRLDADSNSYVSDRAVTVTYSTAQKLPGVGAATGGAAGVDGVDYVTVDSGTFDIEAGENSNVFYVDLVDDDFHEGHEAFQVTIGNAADYDMLVDSGEGVIIEDDPLPLVVVDDAVAVEGEDAVFAVRLIDPADRDKDPADQRPAYSSREITVSYHTYGDADSPGLGADPGVDYVEVPQSPPASFKFLARSATAPSVSIATILDDVTESRESFQLRLAFGVDVDYASLDRGTAVGSITDGLHITLLDACVGSRQQVLPEAHACDAENAAGGMSFTVALVDADGNRLDADSNSYVSDRAVTVTYSTAQKLPGVGAATGGAAGVDGVDYVTVDSGTFDIEAGENSNVFYVELVDDDFHEGHEAFQVTIGSSDYDMLVDSGEGVIIEDDPLPLVVVDDAVAVEGEDAVFAVRLIDPADRDKDPADQRPAYSSRDITVSYHTYGDADSPGLGADPGVDYVEVPQSALGQLHVPGAQHRDSVVGEHRNHPRPSPRVPRELPAAPGCRCRRRLRPTWTAAQPWAPSTTKTGCTSR